MTSAVAASREYDVGTTDGRKLHVYEAGDPNGELVIHHHGTPGAGLIRPEWHDSALARRIRLVGYDRPGYGDSTRQPSRRVVDAATDVAAIADAVGAERFATWGVSGGGPHALACAAVLGERIIAAASLASVAPYTVDDLDFLAGMGQDNVDEFGAAVVGEESLAPFLERVRTELLAASPEQIRDLLSSILPDVDKAVLTGDFASYLHAGFGRGLAESYDGWLDDDLAFVADWGFDVASIGVPVLLMQGEQDLMVPYTHGEWLSKRIPGVEARLSPADGHLTLIAQIDAVHEWLLSHR